MDEGRRRFLMRAAGAVATGCGGASRPSAPACGDAADGPGLGYCLVESRSLRIPGAARFSAGQVTIMLLDDNSGAIVARDAKGFYALSATCTHACCNVNVCADAMCASATLDAPACDRPQPSPLA